MFFSWGVSIILCFLRDLAIGTTNLHALTGSGFTVQGFR
jgi:hypothetical protein